MEDNLDRDRDGKVKPNFASEARPWLFLALTLGITWLGGFTAVALQGRLANGIILLLAYGGGLAPIGVATALAYRHGRSFRRDFWRRIVGWRRIGRKWLIVIVLFHPLKTVLAALIDIAQGGWGIAPEEITRLLAEPLLIAPTLIFWLFFGPVPEEPGWRGYALDGLQSRHGAVVSSFIVGVVWMLWHLPLFFLDGTWQAQHLGTGTLLFWLWMVNVIFESTLYTWIYNNTGRSILAAILFHFMGNAFGQLFAISTRAEVYNTALLVTAVLLVVVFWGAHSLRGAAKERAYVR